MVDLECVLRAYLMLLSIGNMSEIDRANKADEAVQQPCKGMEWSFNFTGQATVVSSGHRLEKGDEKSCFQHLTIGIMQV